MALTIGIVGLPNVGKSTLFNALTRASVLAANYPFATIEPNVGVVPLPDPRLNVLAGIFGSERILPATVSFVDIAGIVKGASEGEGLGNAFLATIREADAICQVTRVFADPDVIHVDGKVDAASDIEIVNTELILADLQTIEKVITRLEKEVRVKKGDPVLLAAAETVRGILQRGDTVSAGAPAAKLDLAEREIRAFGIGQRIAAVVRGRKRRPSVERGGGRLRCRGRGGKEQCSCRRRGPGRRLFLTLARR